MKKTKISGEIRAKIFAQYIGQQVYCESDFPMRSPLHGVVNTIGVTAWDAEDRELHDSFDIANKNCNTFLLLKPISSITDEDAIEVAEILHPGNDRCSIIEKKNGKFVIDIDDSHSTEMSLIIELDFNLFIKPGICNNIHGSDFGRCLNDYNHILLFQFLQSKGYDLPQYLLGGKTLKESGLAIYKQ